MVKVTGDITVSFPASVLPLIYDVENAPMLSFLVRGTSCLDQILPNKALINRCATCQLLALSSDLVKSFRLLIIVDVWCPHG